MNLDRALVLLLASISTVAGFAPGISTTRFVPANTAQLTTRVANTVLGESTDATETVAETESAGEEGGYDVSIYVGNVSFGENACIGNVLQQQFDLKYCSN